MSTRSARLSAVGILLCMLLPLTLIAADAPATPPTRLESLLTAHDVRYALQAPRASSSDCLHSEAERGR
ncbi:MAG TPA: hypothetical protein VGQ22_20050 [Steroidobacteraceae bacterium]|nr:hypothetical protein [Steroidobacteraceae bacterium]